MDPQFWESRYAEPGYGYGTAPNAFLAGLAARFRPGMRVLLPGDGEGRNGAWLAARGCEALSVDLAMSGLRKARRLAERLGAAGRLHAVRADVTRPPWREGAFDAVVAIYVHLPPAVRAAAHRTWAAALRPGGLLVLEAFDRGHERLRRTLGTVGGPPGEALLYTPEMLADDFAGLEIERLERLELELDEGRWHRGRSAVIRLLAYRSDGEREERGGEEPASSQPSQAPASHP